MIGPSLEVPRCMKHLCFVICLWLGLASAEAAPVQSPIDLNTATAAQLMALAGVGPKRAEAILKYRDKKGFRRVRDLLKIRGIGPKRYAQLRDLVQVMAPPKPSPIVGPSQPAPAIAPSKLPKRKFRNRRPRRVKKARRRRPRRRRAPSTCSFTEGSRTWVAP